MSKKIGYVNFGENYLIATEEGEMIKIEGEREFNNYLKENNCEIV